MSSVPRPTRYFSQHFILLRILGLGWWHHPDEGDTRNFPGWYLYYSIVTQLVWVVAFVGLETIDPFLGEKDIDRFMFSLSFVITHDLTLIKLYIFYFKNDAIQEIVRTLEIDFYNFYQNNRKNQATVRITRILTASFLFFGWITIGNTNVYGTIQDLRWKAEVAKLNDTSERPSRTLPQPIYIPWKYQSDQSYICTFVLETVGLLWTGHIVMTIDTFIGSVILHMSSQFTILREALVTAYDRTILKLYLNSQHDSLAAIPTNNNEILESSTQDDMEALVLARFTEKEIGLALQETFKNCFLQHQELISFACSVGSKCTFFIAKRFIDISDDPRGKKRGLGWWHHPDEGDTKNFPGWYIYYAIVTQLVWEITFVGLESIDPFIGEKDIDKFMLSLSFVITHDLTLIKIFIFYFKNDTIQEIVRTLEIDLYNFYQNNRKNQATVRITRILVASFLFFGWITIGNTDIYGTILDLRWKAEVAKLNDTSERPPRTLPQPIYIPWNYQSDQSYAFTFVFETMGLLWTGHILITIDTFIASVILHMSSQFTILREALVTAYDRTILKLYLNAQQDSQEAMPTNIDEMLEHSTQDDIEALVLARSSEKEIELALQETFKSCFRQHQILIRCVEKFAVTYSYGFMTQLLSSMAAICVVMVQVSQDASSFKSVRLVTSLAFFMAMIIQLAIQCFTGNELTLQAAGVADAVMQCKWERMPPTVRRMLILVIMRAQHPLRLSAAGFAYMNNDCFIAIMKAAYSYYAVLSQKAN